MKHTSEQMQLAINEWQTTELTKKAFCRQRNISYSTFHYWVKRLNADQGPASGFTEMRIQSREPIEGCEIVFPSGARMTFQGEPSTSWLRELLR